MGARPPPPWVYQSWLGVPGPPWGQKGRGGRGNVPKDLGTNATSLSPCRQDLMGALCFGGEVGGGISPPPPLRA